MRELKYTHINTAFMIHHSYASQNYLKVFHGNKDDILKWKHKISWKLILKDL